MTTYFSLNGFLILVVKNIKGTLIFDKKLDQLSKINKEFGFPDPILQIKKQRTQLNYLMKKNDLKEISIITIISHPSTKTAPDNQEVYEMVIHSATLLVN